MENALLAQSTNIHLSSLRVIDVVLIARAANQLVVSIFKRMVNVQPVRIIN